MAENGKGPGDGAKGELEVAEAELREAIGEEKIAEAAQARAVEKIERAERDVEEALRHERELTIKIGTPKGSFTATFHREVTVAEVIAAAIKEKRLDGGGDAFELFFGDLPLVPTDRTLVSFGVKTGDTLLLAATGSGV